LENRRHLWLGLLIRKERWGLSWKGWIATFILCLGAAFVLAARIYPFLAITQPVDSNLLVVEGWVPNYAINLGATEFATGKYERVLSTGGPVRGMGGYTNDYNTSASVGAGNLRAAGIPAERVQMVPSRGFDRDRTYSAAIALREWLSEHRVEANSFNIVTDGPHARRTRLLFQKAFGDKVKVGIIAAQNPDYDSAHWWRYSEGVKDMEEEILGYLYARLFFHRPS